VVPPGRVAAVMQAVAAGEVGQTGVTRGSAKLEATVPLDVLDQGRASCPFG
jgi:hypothetical protein